jgi:uncharacterized membrane-anchored protein YhcB (DUF1043 family)
MDNTHKYLLYAIVALLVGFIIYSVFFGKEANLNEAIKELKEARVQIDSARKNIDAAKMNVNLVM